jgi:hypothetical protein
MQSEQNEILFSTISTLEAAEIETYVMFIHMGNRKQIGSGRAIVLLELTPNFEK